MSATSNVFKDMFATMAEGDEVQLVEPAQAWRTNLALLAGEDVETNVNMIDAAILADKYLFQAVKESIIYRAL